MTSNQFNGHHKMFAKDKIVKEQKTLFANCNGSNEKSVQTVRPRTQSDTKVRMGFPL